MAEPLKNLVDARVARWMERDVAAAAARVGLAHAFDAARFRRTAARGLDALELLARGWHLARALEASLALAFPDAARVLLAALEAAPPRGEGPDGLSSFRYLPYAFYAQTNGVEHFEPAMALHRALTRQFTAEWSVRPLLERHPARTLARLAEWAGDPDVHVRRLVSEGTRPRLPWAPRLKAFQEDPSPVLALLERLKDDPEDYVRRSVANSLADVAKDHPDVAVAVARRWAKGAPPGRAWVVRHALRLLVKRGHPGALAVLGVRAGADVAVEHPTLTPRRVRPGGEVRVAAAVVSRAAKRQRLEIDYAVHYVKANGATAPKVFKAKRVELDAGARVEVAFRVVFRDLSTRRHHPGRHAIELRVNGAAFPLGSVDLLAGPEAARSGPSPRGRSAAH